SSTSAPQPQAREPDWGWGSSHSTTPFWATPASGVAQIGRVLATGRGGTADEPGQELKAYLSTAVVPPWARPDARSPRRRGSHSVRPSARALRLGAKGHREGGPESLSRGAEILGAADEDDRSGSGEGGPYADVVVFG